MIKKLHHACVTVSDMDRALAFYRDILGLEMTMDFEISGDEFDALFHRPGVRGRLVYFEEGVELAYYFSPSDGKPLSARPWDSGFTFLIFEVSNLEKMYVTLVDKGVEFRAPPKLPSTEVPTEGAVKVAHLNGPDGELISLIELPQA